MIGKISDRGNLHRGKICAGNSPVGEVSVGGVFIGEESGGGLSLGKCPSGNCRVKELPYNTLGNFLRKYVFICYHVFTLHMVIFERSYSLVLS